MTRILLTGKTGQVGWELRRALAPLGQIIATGRGELDLADPDSIRAVIRDARPEIIVNAAGYTAVDDAEAEPDLAMRVNGIAPGILAEEAKKLRALLVHYSTAYVFDGTGKRPYVEDDRTNPVNVYGRSKLAGEHAVAAAGGNHLILRASWIYSLRGVNFLTTFLKLAREKTGVPVVDDQIGSPTWARAVAEATASLLTKPDTAFRAAGIFHLTAAGSTSRFDFARRILGILGDVAGSPAGLADVRPITTSQYPLPAARPLYSVLATDKIRRGLGIAMEPWEQPLRECLLKAGDSTRQGRPSSRSAT